MISYFLSLLSFSTFKIASSKLFESPDLKRIELYLLQCSINPIESLTMQSLPRLNPSIKVKGPPSNWPYFLFDGTIRQSAFFKYFIFSSNPTNPAKFT